MDYGKGYKSFLGSLGDFDIFTYIFHRSFIRKNVQLRKA